MLLLSVWTLSLKPNFHSSTSTNRVSVKPRRSGKHFTKSKLGFQHPFSSYMQLSTVQILHRLTNQEYVLLVVWCLHHWISAWLQPQTEQTSKWGQFLPLHWLRTSLFTLVNSPIVSFLDQTPSSNSYLPQLLAAQWTSMSPLLRPHPHPLIVHLSLPSGNSFLESVYKLHCTCITQ